MAEQYWIREKVTLYNLEELKL